MSNNLAWPSFENLSVSYAEHLESRLRLHDCAAARIQRAWRGQPEPESAATRPLAYLRGAATRRSQLETQVWAFEKLDGTNFGVSCEGTRVGRRLALDAGVATYQRVRLDEAVPTGDDVRALKARLASVAGEDAAGLPELVLYGELMCNPTKYTYDERMGAVKFAAFGARFKARDVAAARATAGALQAAGMPCVVDTTSGKLTLLASPAFLGEVAACGVATVPLLASGPLWDVLQALEAKMLENATEGVVLTGVCGFIRKWKTGEEDESKGHLNLAKVLKPDNRCRLVMCEDSVAAATLLHRVACNRNTVRRAEAMKAKAAARAAAKQEGGDTPKQPPPYAADVLAAALASALTKYDDLEVFFATDKKKEILNMLVQELTTDLAATDKRKILAVSNTVHRHVQKQHTLWRGELC